MCNVEQCIYFLYLGAGVHFSGQDVFLHGGVQAEAQRNHLQGRRDTLEETDPQTPLPSW